MLRPSYIFTFQLFSLLLLIGSASATPVFINEIHYDNNGRDINEGFEVAGPADTDLSGWQLELYNGNNGQPYRLVPLAGVITDQSAGFGVLGFAVSGVQNGAPDGVALVDHTDQVRQFLSYEGHFLATVGSAAGLISLDIGVSEEGSSAVGASLQLLGTGSLYEDFHWASGVAQSFGQLNQGQTFRAAGADEAVVAAPNTALLCLFAGCLLMRPLTGRRKTGLLI